MSLKTKDLIIGYHSPLLHVEDFTLDTGNIYAIVGRNGSGKSTFLKTLTKQIQAISGNVFIHKKAISTIPLQNFPKYISFVPSRFPDTEYIRVEEFIAMGRNPYTNFFGSLTREDLKKINHSLHLLNISHLKGRFTTELSDGEKQLVAIARSLTQSTPYILLDEPTAFLDYPNKQNVFQLLKRISIQENICVLLSSHDLEQVIKITSKFLLVNKEDKIIHFENSIQQVEDIVSKIFI